MVSSPRRAGFTLVELLVVMAIIGVLIGMLLPAVQRTRETANRMSCTNNMKQLGIAMHNYLDSNHCFPAGYLNKTVPEYPLLPPSKFRWSWEAQLTPYLEQSNVYNSLNLNIPLYDASNNVFPVNQGGVSCQVPTFLCPSDPQVQVYPNFGQTNYVACLGSGINGGSRTKADGICYNSSHTTVQGITDGLSNTALFSEQILGPGGPTITPPDQPDVRLHYGRKPANAPVSDAICAGITQWLTDRGGKWADGEVQYSLYDHHYPPNPQVWDCIAFEYSWKPARSRHQGGVNLALADGSVRFVANNVSLQIWQALGSRDGGESFSNQDF